MPVLLGIYIHAQHITDLQYYSDMSTSLVVQDGERWQILPTTGTCLYSN